MWKAAHRFVGIHRSNQVARSTVELPSTWKVLTFAGASAFGFAVNRELAATARDACAFNEPTPAAYESSRLASRRRRLKVFSGTANVPLAKDICEHLQIPLGELSVKRFQDGEIGIQILENVRGKDVFLIQPTCPPVNDNLMELILMASTMRRSSARSVTVVVPYFGYARQDRKIQPRVPISAADVARLLEAVGIDRVVSVDLHCGQIQGFFGPSTPADNLEGAFVALHYFRKLDLPDRKTVVVSPDAGGVHRAKKFASLLKKNCGIDANLAMIIKQRSIENSISSMDLVGDVEGQTCVVIDDMIDTAGTLCKAAGELKFRGADKIYAYATHGVFSGSAIERIRMSQFEKVIVSDTVPQPAHKRIDKIEVLSIAPLLAEAISRIHFKRSVSQLFDVDTIERFSQDAFAEIPVDPAVFRGVKVD